MQSVALDVLFGAQNQDAATVANREALSQFYVTGVEQGRLSSVLSADQLANSIASVTDADATLSASCDALLDSSS